MTLDTSVGGETAVYGGAYYARCISRVWVRVDFFLIILGTTLKAWFTLPQSCSRNGVLTEATSTTGFVSGLFGGRFPDVEGTFVLLSGG